MGRMKDIAIELDHMTKEQREQTLKELGLTDVAEKPTATPKNKPQAIEVEQ